MIWFVFILISAFFVIYAFLPFFDRNYRSRRISSSNPEYDNLLHRKEEVFAALSDLEYDFRLKKIGEPDYLQVKEKLTLEAIDLMKQIDQLSETPSPSNVPSKKVNADTAKLQS